MDMGVSVSHPASRSLECKKDEMSRVKVLKVGQWVLLALITVLALSSCKGGPTRGILSFMPDTIDGFWAFFHASIVIFLAGIVLQFLLQFVGIGGLIVDAILFVLVLWLRDYGFFMTLLLFIFPTIVILLLHFVYSNRREG